MSPALREIRPWHGAWHDPRADGWREDGIATVIALAYLLLLVGSASDLGYARDEGFYFDAARSYQAWFELLARSPHAALAAVDDYWRVNSEHPALVKSLFALSHAFGARAFSLEGTSFRFPAMVLSSMGVGLVYLWGARVRGRLAGAAAAGSLAAMPRFFFHAHLACFDAPIVALWLLAAYAYWRALSRGGDGRALVAGIAFGLALDTKHNSWFLPIACAFHAAIVCWRAQGAERRVAFRRGLATLVSMAVFGPLTLIALWPWLWRHPLERFLAYARFPLGHVYYNMEFLGRNYFEPPMPRAYAFVMTAATVPVITLVAFVVGLAVTFTRRRATSTATPATTSTIDARAEVFWLIAIVIQYAAWLRSTTPIFGGTKHWMTAYPFVALFAGIGVAAAVRHARARWGGRGLSSFARSRALEPVWLAAAVLVPAIQAGHAHPWALSHYNVLAGGAAGGATLGLNRGFWGYTTGALAPYLNRVVPPDGTVYPHDTAAPSWDMLLRDRSLRPDIHARWSLARADVALYHHELHMRGVEYQAWVAFDTAAPDEIAGLDGVPVIWSYRRADPEK